MHTTYYIESLKILIHIQIDKGFCCNLYLSLSQDISDSLELRLATTFGAFPALILLAFDSEETEAHWQHLLSGHYWSSVWNASLSVFRRDLSATLRTKAFRNYALGSCASWFLFDVYFFSNVLMQARVLRKLIMYPRVVDLEGDTEFIASLGLVSSVLFWIGGLVSVWLLQRVSALGLQAQGTFCSADINTDMIPHSDVLYLPIVHSI
jgi:hypothetical protein